MTPQNKAKSEFQFKSDQLSFISALLLGDGSLAKSGRLVLRHGFPQQDYVEWKAKKLTEMLQQTLTANKTTQCYQVQVQRKYLRDWYYKVYPNGKKHLVSLLNHVTTPLEAIAIWICDDGNVSPSLYKKTICYSAALQIFTFTDLEESQAIADWFESKTGIRPYLCFMNREKDNRKSGYKLRFSSKDSKILYKLIKPYIPDISSMKYKFRYMIQLEYNPTTRPQELQQQIVIQKIV